MSKQYSVREFIRLSPPQKARLQNRDPEQYNRLKKQMEEQFSIETDPEAAAQLAKK